MALDGQERTLSDMRAMTGSSDGYHKSGFCTNKLAAPVAVDKPRFSRVSGGGSISNPTRPIPSLLSRSANQVNASTRA